MSSFSLHIQPTNNTKLPPSFTPKKCSCLFIPSISLSSPLFSSKPIFFQTNRRRKDNPNGSVLPVSCIDSSSSSTSTTSASVEEDYQILTAMRSNFNDIVILETAARILLLDSTNNVHSIFNKGNKWTSAYWDQFVSLPPIVPKGPIALFGLGGGTAAHLLLEVWPSLQLDGWEIDEILSWMKLPKDEGANYMALTGPLPDLTQWCDALPDILRPEVQRWRTCSPS